MIWRNGVVVFSCEQNIYVPVWVALFQLLALANVLLRSLTHQRLALDLPKIPTLHEHDDQRLVDANGRASSQKAAGPQTRSVRPFRIILRAARKHPCADAIHLATSVMTFAHYTYSTAIFASMTMFPASDALRCMALFAVSAGIGRLIGGRALGRHSMLRRTVVYDVKENRSDSLKKEAEEIFEQLLEERRSQELDA